ncbi:hypothetical protein UFOVP860_64 [uncultured Caudovirales phage]|uniref:Uncharacterized protein n=1 Tax=uncultured Caudovirales phage TaxID=2100421 RepID=A0A6J5RHS1_9CAUD|nr:hypothetical protein UFOVP860_64 [uncultured Caudovirales phage]CAB4195632.1 hypothetical protein UFOVP1293_47 [uncultured Caudovirales phage]CAB4222562.1 hypothetical protein UFOVP1644_65 [uncultured Caudovirales phage]
MSATEQPVLAALRQILQFKDHATVSEVAKVTGLPLAEVLRRINANGHMVWRNRKNGHITKVAPREVLRDQFWNSGAYYHVTEYDYGSTKGLAFKGHDELRKKLELKAWGGGLGDSYAYSYVADTPENRQALEEAGCVAFEDIAIDDSLWNEGPK